MAAREAGDLQQCFSIRGIGGFAACIAVQERLQNFGLCSYTRWDPQPPDWRFFFETNLTEDEIISLLGNLRQRYQVHFQ